MSGGTSPAWGQTGPPAPAPRRPRSTSPAPSQVPLRICLGAAGVLGRVIGGWWHRRDELLEVHHALQKGVGGRRAFQRHGARALGDQLQGEGRKKSWDLPGQRSGERRGSWAFICTRLGTGPALAPCPPPPPAWECCPAPSAPGPGLGLTTWTMSREKIWMQHTTAESVQMMVERTVKPQTLKRRSWGGAG